MGKKEQYKQRNEQYMIELRNQEGISELRGGVLYKVLASGDGRGEVNPRSIVTCHYKGSTINGHVFDETFSSKCPAAFRVNDLINGFQIALVNMHIGDRWLVYIPADMGYGKFSQPGIPAFSTLIFEIELVGIG